VKPVRETDLHHALLRLAGRTPQRTAPATDAAQGVGPRPLHILVAEDTPLNQKLAKRLLEELGHTVVVAANGVEALDAHARERFDLVLMGVQMPEIGGFEATATIRARERAHGGHTPIVAMTAHAMAGYRERCLAAGMDDYIAKPIRRPALVAVLDRVAAALDAAEETA
jgi:CheY-like chemotaxis protein